jgi:hypothetical protein
VGGFQGILNLKPSIKSVFTLKRQLMFRGAGIAPYGSLL